MSEDIKQILNEYKEETNRHFDVVAEDIKSKIETVSEQVATNTEKLEEHDQRFNKIDETLETIKLDIEVVKNDLKQKIGRDEFVVLEKRVSLLESKQK